LIRYQITDGSIAPSPDADFIQIRNAALNARELSALVRAVLGLGLRGAVLVNDRLDVALATGAAGVHLRSHAISPLEVRRVVPAGFLITVACHCAADVLAAEGADYALLSPIFAPLSKSDDRMPLGLEELSRIAAGAAVPVLALGGITVANARLCVEAGAAGVAGISLFSAA
jgi:thiamine-phosphate pyrophosphorylase